MNYKIAICDDSQADRDYVASLVRRWASEGDRTAHIEAFSSAEGFLFHYAEESDFDILLLDIEMGGMDGVTLAKRLRQSNDTVQIIFITGYSDYIAEGYEVAALHYLVKPLDENKLFSVLDRAAKRTKRCCTWSSPGRWSACLSTASVGRRSAGTTSPFTPSRTTP